MKIQTILVLIFCSFFSTITLAQENDLPFKDITITPEKFTNETIFARMIHGLGFRFYWATEGLKGADLAFRFSKESRTTEETIDHIMGLSKMMLNAVQKLPNTKSEEDPSSLPFEVKRKLTLFKSYF